MNVVSRCEHWTTSSKLHRNTPAESYDLSYLEALFENDVDEIQHVERAAAAMGIGPGAPCRHSENFGSTRTTCRVSSLCMMWPFISTDSQRLFVARHHRNVITQDVRPSMLRHVTCSTRFRILIPRNLDACPKIILLSRGPHTHHIPIPSHPPLYVREILRDLLFSLGEDLAGATPRGIMRHSVIRAGIAQLLPDLRAPMLGDLHPSLFNKDVLAGEINIVRKIAFPHGMDLEGVCIVHHLGHVLKSKLCRCAAF